MSRKFNSWSRFAVIAGVSLLAACSMADRQTVSAAPPPPATGHASAYQVAFAPGSDTINLAGQRAMGDVSSMVDGNKAALVTIVGRTDATGSADENMQLSKRRAANVRDALLSLGKIDPTHVNTAWTGEERQDVGTNKASPRSRTASWICTFTRDESLPCSDPGCRHQSVRGAAPPGADSGSHRRSSWGGGSADAIGRGGA